MFQVAGISLLSMMSEKRKTFLAMKLLLAPSSSSNLRGEVRVSHRSGLTSACPRVQVHGCIFAGEGSRGRSSYHELLLRYVPP